MKSVSSLIPHRSTRGSRHSAPPCTDRPTGGIVGIMAVPTRSREVLEIMEESSFDGLEDQLAGERKKVDVSAVSFSVRELVRMYESSELTIAPSYQRKYRWTPAVASRFIESVFMGLPIPPIFVATNDDFQWEVVDGLQRISTLIHYLSDDSGSRDRVKDSGPLKLTRLETLSQLNEHGYLDLPKSIQRYFARQPLQVVALTDKANKSVRFDLFERLNSGAISLTSQEVRTAVYRGEFIDFLDRLAENPEFKSLLKLQQVNKNDGTMSEQVLKFFAYKNNQEHFKGDVTNFLNKYAEAAKNSFDFVREERIFVQSMEFLAQLLEGQPFLRNNTSVTPLVQFEACAIAAGHIIEGGGAPVHPSSNWLNDPELVSASTGGTNTRSMLKRRIDRAIALFSDEGIS